MPLTSPGNDDDTGENHQPTLRKNTAEPVEQTLKQNNLAAARHASGLGPVAYDDPVDLSEYDIAYTKEDE